MCEHSQARSRTTPTSVWASGLPQAGSRRLSTSGSRPHGPGCSISTQARTREAVANSGSPSARETTLQVPSGNDVELQEALSDQPPDQDEPALGVDCTGKIGDGEPLTQQQCPQRRLDPCGKRESPVAQLEHGPATAVVLQPADR